MFICLPMGCWQTDNVFCLRCENHIIVNIRAEWAAVHLIHIPGTRNYYVNTTINLIFFNCYGDKQPAAQGAGLTDPG